MADKNKIKIKLMLYLCGKQISLFCQRKHAPNLEIEFKALVLDNYTAYPLKKFLNNRLIV